MSLHSRSEAITRAIDMGPYQDVDDILQRAHQFDAFLWEGEEDCEDSKPYWRRLEALDWALRIYSAQPCIDIVQTARKFAQYLVEGKLLDSAEEEQR